MMMALVRLADFAQIGFIVVGSSLFPDPRPGARNSSNRVLNKNEQTMQQQQRLEILIPSTPRQKHQQPAARQKQQHQQLQQQEL